MVDLFDFGFGVLAIHDTHDSRFSFLDSRSVGLFPTSDFSNEEQCNFVGMITCDAICMHLQKQTSKETKTEKHKKD